jgi:hypothetical protein
MFNFLNSLKTPGNYLIFTHGGLICSLTYNLGLKDVIPPCSVVSIGINSNNQTSEVLFKWYYPDEETL